MAADSPVLDEVELDVTRIGADQFTVQMRARPANSDSDQVLPPAPFAVPAGLADAADDADKYGQLLGDAVFADPGMMKLMQQMAGTDRQQPLRLRVQTSEAAIHNLHWETMQIDKSPLADRSICLSRFISPNPAPPLPPMRPSLRALIFISSPVGIDKTVDVDNPAFKPGGPPDRAPKLAPIDVGRERAEAEKNLKPPAKPVMWQVSPNAIPIDVDFQGSAVPADPNTPAPAAPAATPAPVPDPGSLDALMAKLNEGFDILYMVCHGSIGKDAPCLYMADPNTGAPAVVDAQTFAKRVVALNRRAPRLIVLASCQSAGTGGTGEPTAASRSLQALGPTLASLGVPAVIAMQGFVAIKTAEVFAGRFFAELRVDGQVDRAVGEGRATASAMGRGDYWMPVLFTSSRSGSVFQPYRRGFENDDSVPWTTIIEKSKPGNCTCVPVLGPDCMEPVWGAMSEVASWLADQNGFPLEEHLSEDFPAVAQFLEYKETDVMDGGLLPYLRSHWQENLPAGATGDAIRSALGPWDQPELKSPVWDRLSDLGAARRKVSDATGSPEDVHRLLAKLPYPVYLTACADHVLEDALTAEGKKWRSGYPRWKAELWPKDVAPSDEDHWEPSEKEPYVYHLFGDSAAPNSLVLTDADFDDYMLSINTEETKRYVPSFIPGATTDAPLLFLGFGLRERSFQVVVRNLLRREEASGAPGKKAAWVGAQIPPEKDRYRLVDKAREYIERSGTLKIYWGTTQDFVEEFAQRLRADATLGALLKPKAAAA
jgi:hypothetical protein